jgi:hypothetical protein
MFWDRVYDMCLDGTVVGIFQNHQHINAFLQVRERVLELRIEVL